MSYSKIYTFKNCEESEPLIGLDCVFSDNLWKIENKPDECEVAPLDTYDKKLGFKPTVSKYYYQFIRQITEDYRPIESPEGISTWSNEFIKKKDGQHWLKICGWAEDNGVIKVFLPTVGWITAQDLCNKWVDQNENPVGIKI